MATALSSLPPQASSDLWRHRCFRSSLPTSFHRLFHSSVHSQYLTLSLSLSLSFTVMCYFFLGFLHSFFLPCYFFSRKSTRFSSIRLCSFYINFYCSFLSFLLYFLSLELPSSNCNPIFTSLLSSALFPHNTNLFHVYPM